MTALKNSIISSVFCILLILISYFKLTQWPEGLVLNLAWVMIIGYCAWVLIEPWIVTYDSESAGDKSSDKGSFMFYMIARICVVFSAVIFTDEIINDNPVLLIIALSLLIVGVLFRFSGILKLKESYSHWVRIKEDHKIVDSGPYRIIRHPAYTGTIIAHIGYVLFFSNMITAAFFVLFLVPAIIYRILVEEKVLLENEQYKAYAATKNRIIPFIW